MCLLNARLVIATRCYAPRWLITISSPSRTHGTMLNIHITLMAIILTRMETGQRERKAWYSDQCLKIDLTPEGNFMFVKWCVWGIYKKKKQTVIKGNGSKTLYGQSLFPFKCFTIVRLNYKLIKLISILKSFFFGRLTDWLSDWLASSLINRQIDWLADRLANWLTGWLPVNILMNNALVTFLTAFHSTRGRRG